MKRRAFFASLLMATMSFAMPAAAAVDEISLPTGSGPQGYSTGVSFWPSSANTPGTFQGLRIESTDPKITRVQIVDQYGNRDVLYDGPIQPGQFIAFTERDVAWTAWTDTPGSNTGGVKAIIVYN